MRYDLTAALAFALATTAAAQVAPPPTPDPVEATEAPERQAREVVEGQGLPPTPPPPPTPAPTPRTPTATEPAKWSVNAPPGATLRQVPVNATEGTWINVDVSPDGSRIVFDLLGDLYVMPIAGGTPTRIAEGLAFETHPRWSPDGTRIAFTSDRGGGDNIWVMNADGSDKRQVTRESFRLLNQPSWSPDGRFIAAKKHFTTGRSLGTGEVWLYHSSGGGGVALVERPNPQHQKELGEPTYAPDGRSIYFVRNTTPGPIFEYAQDSNTQLFAIERYDIDSGETVTVTGGPGGAVRPAPSPDGKRLAFVRREAGQSQLWVRDLESGEERAIFRDLDKDMQETWAVHGVYPNMSWTPDSRDIVFWSGGQIRRIAAAGGEARVIPFRISDTRDTIAPVRNRVEVSPAQPRTAMVRFAEASPDGSQVVFESLGRLWVKPARGGTARPLTRGGEGFELFPTWSRDGRRIAFVRWTDAGQGQLRTIAASGGGETLIAEGSAFGQPRYSPNGERLVVDVREGGGLLSDRQRLRAGVYTVATTAGATPEWLTERLADAHFADSDDRIYGLRTSGEARRLVSVNLDGENERVHATGDLVTGYRVSPRGDHFAFRQNYDVYVQPMLPGTQAVGTGRTAEALPVARVSGAGGDYIHWSGDGRTVRYSMGPVLNGVDVAALFRSAPRAEGETAPRFTPPQAQTVDLSMPFDVARPRGTVALTGARVVTMSNVDGGIIDDATIIIEGDRIRAVGPRASVAVPAGATTIDLAGKTVIPGLVDAHAHGPYAADEVIPQNNWSSMVNLALGVTTIHDPSSQASNVFAASEYQQAGLILAPRTFSTGEIVYGARAPGVYAQIDSLDDARSHIRRLRAQGGHSVKNYNQPRREQRQQVVSASQESAMNVVAEGGSLFGLDMTLIADGNTTLEHNIPQQVLYDDVRQFFAATGVGYTPTLVVTYGGLAGDPYWRSHTNVFEQPLLRAHEPPSVLRAANARRSIAPDNEYVDDDSARESHALARLGVPVSIGAHGQEAGIGAHWELWSFVRGGMSPVEALAAGTIVSARSLGYDRDVGSLEAGKLADLVVLDADPTQDIRNSERVSQVMLGGRLYEAATLNETGTGTARRLPYWWEAR